MKKLTLLILILLAELTNAQITFQKTYGGTGDEWLSDARITYDSGFVMIGSTAATGSNSKDIYVVRTGAEGNLLWAKSYGDTSDETGYSIRQTVDGGFIIAATINYAATQNRNIYLIKTNTIGDTLWTKAFDNFMYDFYISISSIEQTTDKGFILSGFDTRTSVNVNYSFLMKTDSLGNFSWMKTFYTVGSASGEGGSCHQTTDGGYIHVGAISYNGGEDVYLIKADSAGNKIWGNIYHQPYNGEDSWMVKQTTDGKYILLGNTSHLNYERMHLIKTDSVGNIFWIKNYGGNSFDAGSCINETNDGGYAMLGHSNSFGAGDWDVYLLKIDMNGNPLWSKTFGGLSDDFGGRVFQTWDGGYISAGSTTSYGAGGVDFYLIKTDSFGNSGCNQSNVLTIVTLDSASIVNTSSLSGNIFNTISPPQLLINNNINNYSVLCTTGETEESMNKASFTIAPNPSTANFIISFERKITKGKVEIVNILGENTFAENIFYESKKEIKLKNISAGIYFVKVFDGEKSYCKKLIVE